MLLLALDTTTRVCSVALGNTERVWAEYLLNTDNTHSQRLMPLIISLLKMPGFPKTSCRVLPYAWAGIIYRYPHRYGNSKKIMPGLNIPVVGVMTLMPWQKPVFPQRLNLSGLKCQEKPGLYSSLPGRSRRAGDG